MQSRGMQIESILLVGVCTYQAWSFGRERYAYIGLVTVLHRGSFWFGYRKLANDDACRADAFEEKQTLGMQMEAVTLF